MSAKLRKFLCEHYAYNGFRAANKIKADFPIQIDDQDDNDSIVEFCNIFVVVGKNNIMEIELSGGMPITRDLADFAEIYHGMSESAKSRLVLRLTPIQIDALMDLASRIRSTSELGYTNNNPNWDKVSARTISSIYRFVRVVKEYSEHKKNGTL